MLFIARSKTCSNTITKIHTIQYNNTYVQLASKKPRPTSPEGADFGQERSKSNRAVGYPEGASNLLE